MTNSPEDLQTLRAKRTQEALDKAKRRIPGWNYDSPSSDAPVSTPSVRRPLKRREAEALLSK